MCASGLPLALNKLLIHQITFWEISNSRKAQDFMGLFY